MRPLFTFCLALLAALGSAQGLGGVPAPLWSRFKTGVNVTRWFCYVNEAGPDHYRNYLTEQDFAEFKRLHVSFVRLCISPNLIYDNGAINAATLPYVDAALDRFQKAGIAVLWDLHDNGQLKLDQTGYDNSGFIKFWEAAATHYKGQRENEIVFELVNEPQFPRNADVWYQLQEQTVKAVRAIDPRRTIMVSSNGYNGIDTFLKMPPLAESNLIYTFHCYDPFFFTHQGASWAGDQPKLLKNVPFPSSPEAVSAMIAVVPEPVRGTLTWYGQQRYDASWLQKRIATAADWGKSHGVPVVFGEFGSYPPVAPVQSRERWFAAMRAAIDSAHLPYAIWGYDDAMGLGRTVQSDGTIKLDPVTLGSFYKQ
ncbi:MAG: glycoside hydrolase family 5 protein [Fimbriimonadales bacterium]